MIFLSVGFLERALNKGRGPEGYIITATCIPKDIYESCSTSSWWSCWLVLPETSKIKKSFYYVSGLTLLISWWSARQMTQISQVWMKRGLCLQIKWNLCLFFYSNCNIFLTLICSLHSITYRCPIHIPSHNLVTKKVSYQGLLKTY